MYIYIYIYNIDTTESKEGEVLEPLTAVIKQEGENSFFSSSNTSVDNSFVDEDAFEQSVDQYVALKTLGKYI